MKKIFLPLHIWHLIIYLISIFIIGIGVYIIILGFYILLTHNQYESFILIVAGLVDVVLFLYILIYTLHNRIIFNDKKIIIIGHWNIKNEGLQFPDEIEYDEIKDIAIICANANSLKKKIKKAGYSSLRPFIFYEITLKNNETKWIYIECFSRKQRKQMLSIINDKVELNLSYNQLKRKDYSIYKSDKKYKENN
ncbi:MAG: hypothetical protein IJB34_07040 [Clostridia bacterium]|nr:hypothetical protein [Clostridia bacterium]MBQ3506747.1 hypothetical protein [Clostridia bacterium]